MRLLIVGTLKGQLTTATKIAMDNGASVTHAEAIDIYVNNRLVARGEVVLVEDKLGVTMTEILKAERS